MYMSSPNIPSILRTVYETVKTETGGQNASYIPELAKVDPKIYGISICTCDGTIYNIGDYKTRVAIESVSKVFSLILALEERGIKEVQEKIGSDSSFLPFNSAIAMEISNNKTLNPFVNAGAMATTSLMYDKSKKKYWTKIHKNMNNFAGRELEISKQIYKSESMTNGHNKGLAYLLQAHGKFYGDVESSVDIYTKQCSVLTCSEDIAVMAATLANNGINPKTNKKVMSKKNITYVLGQMLVGGLYQYSDDWIIDVGIPSKSGVGGVILCVVPGIMGIGIVSPPLDDAGNSFKGIKTAELLSKNLNLSVLVS